MTYRGYRFFYHFGKQDNAMTIHFRGRCIPAKDIDCRVPTQTKWNKQQPYLVMQGYVREVLVENNKAIIK